MKPKDKSFNMSYQILMNEIKSMNRELFWKANIKRRAIYYLSSHSIFNKLIDKISPYELLYRFENKADYFSEERIAVYTSVFGGYDKIINPIVAPDNCDFFIFTDCVIDEDSIWKKIDISLSDFGLEGKNDIEKNRFFKMHPHKLFPDYKYSIYIDGNIKIMTDLTEFIKDMNPYGLVMHNHYRQNCVYKEIKKCKKIKKDKRENLELHYKHLKENGMPNNYGMLEAPIIVREHSNDRCIKIMEDWWDEFEKYSKRDQISLPYVLFKENIRINEIAKLGNDIYSNFAFKKVSHSR